MSDQVQITRNTKVTASTKQMSSELAGESVILNLANDNYYGLNEVGARVWELIQREPRTVRELCEALQEEYEVTQEQCEQEIGALLEDMHEHDLIVVDGAH